MTRSVKARAIHRFARCFYARGDMGLPAHVDCLGHRYVLKSVLKHDFMAATGLYEAATSGPDFPRRLVCKIDRQMHFLLIPLGLLGRLIARSEVRNLQRCREIRGVPKVVARLDAHTYTYEYIEGKSLSEKPPLSAGFFEDVLAVIHGIHAVNLVHLDLHKPGNILVGDDGRAHIIDFQLCTHVGDRFLLSKRLSSRLRRRLQAYDIYHVYKHKRRLQPQLLTQAEERLSYDHSLPLRVHRAIARPYKYIRRACLRYLHARGILGGEETASSCAETDPTRWTK